MSHLMVGAEASAPKTKQKYSRPTFELYGEVRDLTLGGSGGSGDSANPGGAEYDPMYSGFASADLNVFKGGR